MNRFWDKVDKRGPDECWEWQGFRLNGYGKFKGPEQLAHRMAWLLTNGPIPKDETHHGLCICHKCDNRACCNPKHLFMATVTENNIDRDLKNRHAGLRGEKIGNSKLKERQVRDILRRKGRVQQTQLAKEYGVNKSTISMIHRGLIWKHVA